MLHICDFDTSEKIFISFMSNFILKDHTTPKLEAVNKKKKLKQLNFRQVSCFLFLPQDFCQTNMTLHISRKYFYKCRVIRL